MLGKEKNFINGLVSGEHLRTETLTNIKAGGEEIFMIKWLLPDKFMGTSDDNNTEKHHFCLLARITNSHLDDLKTGEHGLSKLQEIVDNQIKVLNSSKNYSEKCLYNF